MAHGYKKPILSELRVLLCGMVQFYDKLYRYRTLLFFL